MKLNPLQILYIVGDFGESAKCDSWGDSGCDFGQNMILGVKV